MNVRDTIQNIFLFDSIFWVKFEPENKNHFRKRNIMQYFKPNDIIHAALNFAFSCIELFFLSKFLVFRLVYFMHTMNETVFFIYSTIKSTCLPLNVWYTRRPEFL